MSIGTSTTVGQFVPALFVPLSVVYSVHLNPAPLRRPILLVLSTVCRSVHFYRIVSCSGAWQIHLSSSLIVFICLRSVWRFWFVATPTPSLLLARRLPTARGGLWWEGQTNPPQLKASCGIREACRISLTSAFMAKPLHLKRRRKKKKTRMTLLLLQPCKTRALLTYCPCSICQSRLLQLLDLSGHHRAN